MMEFYNEKWVTARKEQCCECCGKKIEKGEKYSRQSGKWYEEFFSRAYCVTCYGAVSDYCCEIDNEFSYDSIQEFVFEKFCKNCVDRKADTDEECEKYVYECPRIVDYYEKDLKKQEEFGRWKK